jgi:hydroxyacylglutathione hydrolase
MNLQILPIGPFEANCVLVSDESGLTLVVDPGADARALDEWLDRKRLTVAAYLLTHGHADHMSALYDLWKQRPAPVIVHPGDAEWAFTPLNELLPHYPATRRPEGPYPEVGDGTVFTFGQLTFRVIATPGHTPGCVCFYFEKEGVLLTGDTLFQDSVGRTDLPGGDSRTLAASLLKLAVLPASVRVVAGHGDETTIGDELRSNFFMQQASKTLTRQRKNNSA